MGKAKLIDCVVYPYWLLVSVAQTDDELIKVAKRMVGADAKDLSDIIGVKKDGMTLFLKEGPIPGKSNVMIVRVYGDIKSNHGKSVLAHELFHATDFILRDMGFRLSDDSQEAWAYLLDYFTEKTLEAVE